tara:strand:+ start:767 stop:1876 length:1110 start_codon:yes stop_codon:yes gene_type:complete
MLVKKKYPYYSLDFIHKKNKINFIKIFNKVFDNSNFILGDELKNFEKKFSEFVGSKYCLGVGNGFDALRLILASCNIGHGDEVIVSSHTFIATWHSISSLGAIPVPVDSNYDTFNINVNQIEDKISKKTKAIVGVHIYGQSVEISKIKKICKKYNIYFFEDASQAHGGKYLNKFVGNLSDAAAFSFYPTKNIGALGDAGAITTNNFQIYKTIQKLRNYGSNKSFQYELVGFNSRMDEIQAAFLNYKISNFKYLDNLKSNIASMYNLKLPNIPNIFELPVTLSKTKNAWHHYVVKVKNRNKFIKYLEKHNIKILIHYKIPPHKHKSYKHLEIKSQILPNTEKLYKRIVSLPTYDYSLAKKVIKLINFFYN